MVFLHCTGPGMGPGTRTGSMCSNILCRNVHIAVADPRERQGSTPPLDPKSFIFMQFSAKNLQNNSVFFCSLLGIWHPLENPGSVTALVRDSDRDPEPFNVSHCASPVPCTGPGIMQYE